MIPREDILKILKAGVQAPSGENSQPWLFRIDEDGVDLFNDPEKDTSLYNHEQRSNLISYGCFIENVFIASEAMGYHAGLQLFPDENNRNLIASLHFTKKVTQYNDQLYAYIERRSTNRKPYKKIPLLKEHKEGILDSVSLGSGVTLKLNEDPTVIEKLAEVGAVNEKIIFENKELHRFLFRHLTWTKEEDEKKPGFYIETLELPSPAKILFRLFQSWRIMSVLNKIGFSNLIKKGNQKTYEAASAMGIIITAGKSDKDFVHIGRALQRIWLTATKLGLALQPLTGVLFFMQAIQGGESKRFSVDHLKEIQNQYGVVCKIFDIGNENIPVMFRIGYDGEPSARTVRFPVEKFII